MVAPNVYRAEIGYTGRVRPRLGWFRRVVMQVEVVIEPRSWWGDAGWWRGAHEHAWRDANWRDVVNAETYNSIVTTAARPTQPRSGEMSKILEELKKATDVEKRAGEAETDMLGRIHKEALKISDDAWNALDERAQDWVNAVTDKITAKQPVPPYPPFPDAAKTRERKSGETADATSTPAAAAFEPKKGANVTITDKRGRIVHGIIVDIDDDTVVLNKDGEAGTREDDVDIVRKGASIVPSNTKEAAELETKAAEATSVVADEEVFPRPPEIGDKVKATNMRDKVVEGTVIAIDDEEISIADAEGKIFDFVIKKLKDCQITHRVNPEPTHAQRPEPAATQAATAAADAAHATAAVQAQRDAATAPAQTTIAGVPPTTVPDAAKPVGRGKAQGGVSVGNRVRDIMIEDPSRTLEQVTKMLKDEGYTAADATVKMTRTDALYIIEKMKAK